MSKGRSDTISKRKRSTPQKFKGRKLFAAPRHDILEVYTVHEGKSPVYTSSPGSDGHSESPNRIVTPHRGRGRPKGSTKQPEYSRARDGGVQENQLSLSKLPVTLQNKENLPEKCPNGSVTPARGRGRPKGSKNKTFPTLPTKVYAVREGKSPVYTSRPGSDSESPNRIVTPHRGRGRPKGSTKVKPVGEDVPKRSRGRPKGSKNKKPTKATLLKMLTSGEKIGRGRPRKIPHGNVDEALTPKQGRGRPKGSLNKVTSVKRLLLMAETFEVKKRGRPRKILLHHSALMSLTPKRPRGRPRKEENFAPLPSHDHEMKSSESNTEDEDDIDRDEEDNDDDDDDYK